jgi:hypothetical protein
MKLISEFSATVASDSHSHPSRGNRHNLETSTDRNTQRPEWEMRVILEEAVEGFFLFFVEEGGLHLDFLWFESSTSYHRGTSIWEVTSWLECSVDSGHWSKVGTYPCI